MKNIVQSAFIALFLLMNSAFVNHSYAAGRKAASEASPQATLKEDPARPLSLKEKLVAKRIKSVLKRHEIRQSSMDDATKVVLIILGVLLVAALFLVLLIVAVINSLDLSFGD
ncbi:MAG: hypothetical protein ACJ75J_03770 [Cytophagaceae bacterium]